MKSRKTLGLLVAIMVSMFCVSSVFANSPTSRVTVGQNYYGDVLLGQIYNTTGYSTKIQVVNTSTDTAIVAKVVFRSPICSIEVLDFYIYLSPTDMWDAVVRLNDAGKVEIYSDDESVLASALPNQPNFEWDAKQPCNPFIGVWASPERPFKKEFVNPHEYSPGYIDTGVTDINAFGHFEVHGLSAFKAFPPTDKDAMAIAYNHIGLPIDSKFNETLKCVIGFDANYIDVPNTLTGFMNLTRLTNNQSASLNMTALQNWSLKEVGFADRAGYDSKLNYSDDNSIPEIEAALAKTEYAIPFDYSNDDFLDTIIVNTLPTHYLAGPGNAPKVSGIFKGTRCHNLTGIGYKPYDMEETLLLRLYSPLPLPLSTPEVSFRSLYELIKTPVLLGYDKGWVRVIYPADNASGNVTGTTNDNLWTVTARGVPTINSYITFDNNLNMVDWNYAASPESVVTYDPITPNNLPKATVRQ